MRIFGLTYGTRSVSPSKREGVRLERVLVTYYGETRTMNATTEAIVENLEEVVQQCEEYIAKKCQRVESGGRWVRDVKGGEARCYVIPDSPPAALSLAFEILERITRALLTCGEDDKALSMFAEGFDAGRSLHQMGELI